MPRRHYHRSTEPTPVLFVGSAHEDDELLALLAGALRIEHYDGRRYVVFDSAASAARAAEFLALLVPRPEIGYAAPTAAAPDAATVEPAHLSVPPALAAAGCSLLLDFVGAAEAIFSTSNLDEIHREPIVALEDTPPQLRRAQIQAKVGPPVSKQERKGARAHAMRFEKTDAPRSNFDYFLPGKLGQGAFLTIFQIISTENWNMVLYLSALSDLSIMLCGCIYLSYAAGAAQLGTVFGRFCVYTYAIDHAVCVCSCVCV